VALTLEAAYLPVAAYDDWLSATLAKGVPALDLIRAAIDGDAHRLLRFLVNSPSIRSACSRGEDNPQFWSLLVALACDWPAGGDQKAGDWWEVRSDGSAGIILPLLVDALACNNGAVDRLCLALARSSAWAPLAGLLAAGGSGAALLDALSSRAEVRLSVSALLLFVRELAPKAGGGSVVELLANLQSDLDAVKKSSDRAAIQRLLAKAYSAACRSDLAAVSQAAFADELERDGASAAAGVAIEAVLARRHSKLV